MKIVYSWLRDFIDIDVTAERLAEALTSVGLEVSSIEKHSIPKGVIVGRVLEVRKHPNADKLSVCRVDTGSETPLDIVCGAPNVSPGMLAPFAAVGTVLAPDLKVGKMKIRGVESFGMLCSEKELGISDDHRGLMVLPPDMAPGKPLSDYFPDDIVIEIEITPDRGDCMSMLGVARVMAARFNVPLKRTALFPHENKNDPIDKAIKVIIEAPAQCPRYTGRLVRNVRIGPSPRWLSYRLSLAGIRPINNVVDITNYMLLHFGQPMHAFDYARICDQTIVVKTASEAGKFLTLDNIERKLDAGDLIIADGKRPVALAGIMGGAGSEITDETTDVFLECAFFEPTGIRKTSKRLGISTDSSYRFERGVDPEGALIDALDTAAALLEELAGGKVCSERIDIRAMPFEKRTITLRPQKVCSVLGVSITYSQIISILKSLQIECSTSEPETIKCTVPTFRHDLVIEEDLIEEVGRLYGYDNIPPSETVFLSLNRSLPVVEKTSDAIRYALAFSGLREAVTGSMTSQKKCSLLTPSVKAVPLRNPLNPDMAFMRTTLAGSLLEITAYNCNRKNFNNRFFEIGKVFEQLPDDSFIERHVVGILIEGDYFPSTWNSPAIPVSFYILKGIIEAFAVHLGFPSCVFSPVANLPAYFTCESASVAIGDTITGYAGLIDKSIAETFEIKTTVCYAELDITKFLETSVPVPSYKPLPRFPALEWDFCFVMDEQTRPSDICRTISELSPLIEEVYPFDVYRGEKVGERKKSITFTVKLRSTEKTLTDEECEPLFKNIIEKIEHTYKAVLRR